MGDADDAGHGRVVGGDDDAGEIILASTQIDTSRDFQVARKINPQHTGLKIVPVTKERYSRFVMPLLRSPYNLMPFALYKRTTGKGMYMLFRGSEFIKAGTKAQLKRYAA